MTDDAPKRGPGRPRIHATQEAAEAANAANIRAHNAARITSHVIKRIALTPAEAARAASLIKRRGLKGYAALFMQLVDEAHARDTET